MTVSTCPNCGSSQVYRCVHETSASGGFGPNLLPELSWARFRVVVCKDCGLTRLFASAVDRQALSSPGWERVSDVVSSGPLGPGDARPHAG